MVMRVFLTWQRWRDLVIETDPDIIIGYNICNFDLPYLIKRAETLKVHNFPYWGRNRKMCELSFGCSQKPDQKLLNSWLLDNGPQRLCLAINKSLLEQHVHWCGLCKHSTVVIQSA